jgi:hypothetical protein
MTSDQWLAGFVSGLVHAALDMARERGLPSDIAGSGVDPETGAWTIEVSTDSGSKCTVTVVPGPATGPGSERSGSR